MPYSNVRLVHAFYDHRDGQYKEVIVDKVKLVPTLDEFGIQTKDPMTGELDFERFIPGMDVNIPWPAPKDPDPEQHEADTAAPDVELPTFEPSLLTPPMPMDAIDEIRNPYTPSRQDHTDEFLAKREQMEKERQAREESALQVRTPLQELKAQREAARRARGDTVRRTVPEEVLEKLGAVIRARGKTEHVKSAWMQKEAANRKRELEEQRRQKHREELMALREAQKERDYKPKPKTYVV
jgi:large subunit ribosomal protein L24